MKKYLALLLFCYANAQFVAAHDREICFVLPLTGGQAAFGQSVMHGAILAKEEADCVKEKQFCALRNTELRFEDHSGEPSRSVASVQKLLSSNACSSFVVFGSPTSLAVSDLLEHAGKLTISIATSDKIQTGKKFIFRSMASAAAITAPLVAEVSRLQLKNIVSISTIHDGMFAYRDAFEAQRNLPYIKRLEVNPADTDFRSLALQVKSLKPESIFVTLLPPQGALFAKQVRDLGYTGQLFAANQLESPAELKAAGAAFDGLWYAREGTSTPQAFDQSIERRFPGGDTIFSPNGYDAVRLLTLALDQADPRLALETVAGYVGASGKLATLANHSFSSEVRLMEVKGGKFSLRLVQN
jgi:branched-chain amino acid transport system substrate-binding protein